MAFRRRNVEQVLGRTPDNCALMGTVGADGKRRNMIMITADAARTWLFSVSVNRVAPQVRVKPFHRQLHGIRVLVNAPEYG